MSKEEQAPELGQSLEANSGGVEKLNPVIAAIRWVVRNKGSAVLGGMIILNCGQQIHLVHKTHEVIQGMEEEMDLLEEYVSAHVRLRNNQGNRGKKVDQLSSRIDQLSSN